MYFLQKHAHVKFTVLINNVKYHKLYVWYITKYNKKPIIQLECASNQVKLHYHDNSPRHIIIKHKIVFLPSLNTISQVDLDLVKAGSSVASLRSAVVRCIGAYSSYLSTIYRALSSSLLLAGVYPPLTTKVPCTGE
jgi:hypothetical protein